jgi:hypothetical protein
LAKNLRYNRHGVALSHCYSFTRTDVKPINDLVFTRPELR